MQEQYEAMIEELDKVITEKEFELIHLQSIQTNHITDNGIKETQIAQLTTYIEQLKQMREDYRQYLTNYLIGRCCDGECCKRYY